jgi:uncharacterized protein
MDVYVKLSKNAGHVVLAICDCELLGKTLHEGKIVFKIKDEFYNGGKRSVEEAITLIDNSTIVNLVGAVCVERAIKEGFVHPEAVIKIEGVPHAQIMKL